MQTKEAYGRSFEIEVPKRGVFEKNDLERRI